MSETQWQFYLQHVNEGDSKPFFFMQISSDPMGFGKLPKFRYKYLKQQTAAADYFN